MGSSAKLKTVRSTMHEEVATFLRRMADRADAGEIVGVTVIEEHPGGTYRITGSRTMSRLHTMGALFEAALMRSQE